MEPIEHAHSAKIDALGGTSAAARFFEVKAASVSKWRKKGIPRARLMYARIARPDIFGQEPQEPLTDKEALPDANHNHQ